MMPNIPDPCKFCGEPHGGHCPHVKRIFKLEDGSIRRVEFFPYTPTPVEFPTEPSVFFPYHAPR